MAQSVGVAGADLQAGYDVRRFVDENKFVTEFLCSICSEVLREPLCTPCEHYFCALCIRKWLDSRPTCPIDREPLHASQLQLPSRMFNSVYEKLALHCQFVVHGCQRVLCVADIASHEKECPRRVSRCKHDDCKFVGKTKELEEHEPKCAHRPEQCKQCNLTVKVVYMETHTNDLCPESPQDCECGGRFVRRLLDVHKRDECPLTIISCPVNVCSVQLRRGDLDAHLSEPQHAPLLREQMLEMSQRLEQKERTLMETTFRLASTETRLTRIRDDMLYQIRANQGSTTRWVINNVRHAFDNAVNTQGKSGPDLYNFSSGGYCFRMWIYFNGDREAYQGNVSVFFVLRPGMFDDSLTWPFNKKVSFTLVDQHGNGERSVQKTLNPYTQENTRRHFEDVGKPTEQSSVQSNGFGWGKFLTRMDIDDGVREFIKDDRLFIDIVIE